MSFGTAIAAFSAAAIGGVLLPAVAYCAEGEGTGSGSWVLLGFFAINFALFAYLLARFAGAAIRSFFSDRAQRIRGTLARAKDTFQKAQDLANQAAARLARLEGDKRKLADELRNAAALEANRIRDDARSAAQRIASDAQTSASAMADAAQRRVRQSLASAAAALAHDLIAQNFKPADQGRLLGDFVGKLGQEARS